MELRQLKYFKEACERQNFSEAARVLHISQSTLSQQIKQLEDELDVLLFDRIGKRIVPTEAGHAFLPYAVRAIHDVVYTGMPLISRIVTVSGDILMEPKNLLVPIGTSFNDLIDACGHSENPYKVLSGGPMMGVAQYDLNVPTIKGVNAVTVLGKKNNFFVEEPHCLRCGKCIEVCPMHLMPVLMYQATQDGDVDGMKSANLLDCIECGCCAYTCPASVPLVLGFRAGKQMIRNAAAREKAKA